MGGPPAEVLAATVLIISVAASTGANQMLTDGGAIVMMVYSKGCVLFVVVKAHHADPEFMHVRKTRPSRFALFTLLIDSVAA